LGRCAGVVLRQRLVNIIEHWSNFAEQLSSRHVPLPPLFLVVGLILV